MSSRPTVAQSLTRSDFGSGQEIMEMDSDMATIQIRSRAAHDSPGRRQRIHSLSLCARRQNRDHLRWLYVRTATL